MHKLFTVLPGFTLYPSIKMIKISLIVISVVLQVTRNINWHKYSLGYQLFQFFNGQPPRVVKFGKLNPNFKKKKFRSTPGQSFFHCFVVDLSKGDKIISSLSNFLCFRLASEGLAGLLWYTHWMYLQSYLLKIKTLMSHWVIGFITDTPWNMKLWEHSLQTRRFIWLTIN